jgi:hypothetical protein
LGEMHLFRGSLHSCFWELFFTWILVVLFFDGVEPFCLTLRSWQFGSILSRLCRAVALALGDRDFSHSSDLVLAFVCLLITCLSFSVVCFLFLFSLNWLLVCVVNASSRWRLRTGASKDRWMVAPGCDEWLGCRCILVHQTCSLHFGLDLIMERTRH